MVVEELGSGKVEGLGTLLPYGQGVPDGTESLGMEAGPERVHHSHYVLTVQREN